MGIQQILVLLLAQRMGKPPLPGAVADGRVIQDLKDPSPQTIVHSGIRNHTLPQKSPGFSPGPNMDQPAQGGKVFADYLAKPRGPLATESEVVLIHTLRRSISRYVNGFDIFQPYPVDETGEGIRDFTVLQVIVHPLGIILLEEQEDALLRTGDGGREHGQNKAYSQSEDCCFPQKSMDRSLTHRLLR